MKSSDTTTDTIMRSAARLRVAVLGTILAMVGLYGAARFGLQIGPAHVEYRVHGPDGSFGRLIGDATLALLAVALFRLSQMLGRIAAGETFSLAVVSRFRSFALWLLVSALFGLFAPFVLSIISPSGGHRFALILDFQKILTVGVTLVLFLLARLLERARRLDEEMQQFV